MDKWLKRWKVNGSNGNVWTVAIDVNGQYGCSCPVWKFKREECHHIAMVKAGGGTTDSPKPKPEYVLAAVRKPVLKADSNELLIPLVAIGDPLMMEATICYYLLMNGYSMSEIRELRCHIPSSWSAKAIRAHIATHGEAEYPEGWYKY